MEVEEEPPEEGELVIATVRQITPHGVYVSLDEYGGMNGFLHVSEIATGWVRSIERFVKPAQKIVLKVIRVSRARGEIDLSLRQVTGEEKKNKLIEVKKAEKASGIMELVSSKLNVSEQENRRLTQILAEHFDSLYDALEGVARGGAAVLQNLELPQNYVTVLEEVVREKIVLPRVEVRGTIELTTNQPDGIELLKKALATAEETKTAGVTVNVTYIGAPRYRIVVVAESYKLAEKALESSLEKIKDVIGKKGTYSFVREQSRKKTVE